MRSSSNMNISWLSEQKSVGNTGVSQACFLLFLSQPMYTSWGQTSLLFLKEYLSCIRLRHGKLKAVKGDDTMDACSHGAEGILQSSLCSWAARLSKELLLLYLKTSFIK